MRFRDRMWGQWGHLRTRCTFEVTEKSPVFFPLSSHERPPGRFCGKENVGEGERFSFGARGSKSVSRGRLRCQLGNSSCTGEVSARGEVSLSLPSFRDEQVEAPAV